MKRIGMLLVLVSLSFATCSFTPTDPAVQSTIDSAFTLVFAALLFSTVVTALAYMVGKGIASAQLLVFAKDSFTQLLITAVLIVIIFSLMEGTCVFMQHFLDSPTDPLTDSMNYMNQLRNNGRTILKSLYSHSIQEKFEGATLVGFYAPFVGGATGFRGAYHNAFSRQYEILIDMVTVGYVSAGVQYFSLQMIRDFVFPVLIPFGLLLRALPFMREAGNIVLALGFTLLVIMPFAYALNSAALDINPVCDSDKEVAIGSCGTSTGWGTISSYLFQTIFLPNLAMVVTITGAGAMVKAIKVLP